MSPSKLKWTQVNSREPKWTQVNPSAPRCIIKLLKYKKKNYIFSFIVLRFFNSSSFIEWEHYENKHSTKGPKYTFQWITSTASCQKLAACVKPCSLRQWRIPLLLLAAVSRTALLCSLMDLHSPSPRCSLWHIRRHYCISGGFNSSYMIRPLAASLMDPYICCYNKLWNLDCSLNVIEVLLIKKLTKICAQWYLLKKTIIIISL